jgi:hypothetical protein
MMIDLEVADDAIVVTPNAGDRRHPRPERFEGARSVTVVDRSGERTLIVIGTAFLAAVAAGVATSYAVSHSALDDPYGTRALALGVLGAGATGGLSLTVTLPLTRDLGEVLE